MVAERERVFIVGVGRTAFTKVCVNGPTLPAAVMLDSVSRP